MSTAHVAITSEPPGAFLIVGPTSEESVQVVHAIVRIQGEAAAEHDLIVASGSLLPRDKHQTVLSRLAKENMPAAIALIVRESERSATVLLEPQGYEQFPVAAAVVVFKASWGWEEAESIMVVTNGSKIAVRARFNGNTWVVSEQKLRRPRHRTY